MWIALAGLGALAVFLIAVAIFWEPDDDDGGAPTA